MPSCSKLNGDVVVCRITTTTPATASEARSGRIRAGPEASTPGNVSLSIRLGSRFAKASPTADPTTGRDSPDRQASAGPTVSTTKSSLTSASVTSSSTGMATSADSAPVSLLASSAISRKTVVGSVPDRSSVAMSRVDSIQDCRALAWAYNRALVIAMPAAAASA
nr:hypothetical protein CPGR_00389 [Mycolicibacter nonchromogenicus]